MILLQVSQVFSNQPLNKRYWKPTKYAEEILIENLTWLKTHLKSPKILKENKSHRAISWFNPRAQEPLKRIRSIKAILEEFGYYIDQVSTRDPGIIIYEDGFQVVAKPARKST